jgi:EmrB/QacA subfamily drug resistance transporter
MSVGKGISINKNIVLVITVIAALANAIMFSSVNIILPTIGKEFAVGAVMLGWVVNGPSLASAAIMLPFGRLADIYGRRKLFFYGSLITALALILGGTATSITLLICYQVIQGIGSGMAIGTSIAILTSVFPPNERGKALGINVTAIYVGASVGPYLGGVMTQYLGWRSVFFLGAFLLLLVSTLILFKLKGEWADARGERVDIFGSVVLGASLVLLIYGLTRLPGLLGIILMLASLLGIVIFVWWEKRVSSPALDINLFRGNRTFVFSNLATLANYSAIFIATFLLSLYLQYVKGFTPSKAGLVLLVQPVFMAIMAPIAGRLSDRIEPQKIASIGLSFNCVAFLLFSFLTGDSPLWLMIVGLVIQGIGIGLFSSPNTNAIMSAVDKRQLGVASGTVGMMRTVGGTMGIGIIMIIFSVNIGNVQITPEYYAAFQTSMRTGFIIFTIVVLSGFFAQLAGRKKQPAKS